MIHNLIDDTVILSFFRLRYYDPAHGLVRARSHGASISRLVRNTADWLTINKDEAPPMYNIRDQRHKRSYSAGKWQVWRIHGVLLSRDISYDVLL